MRIPSIKTIVTVLAILEVWLLLQVPSVGDLLFNFIVGGEVPGTDKVLSPTQMMLFLIGLFILAAGLIFRKEIITAAYKVGQMNTAAPEIAAVEFKPAPAPVTTVPKVQKKVRKPRQWPVAIAKLTPYLNTIRNMTHTHILQVRAYVCRAWAAVQPVLVRSYAVARFQVRRAAAATQRAVIWICVTELYLMYRLWVAIKAYSVTAWRWLRPRIEQCDRWIERRLHQNNQTSALLEMGSEFTATVRAWIVRIRAMLSQ
jgi:hypothetical protein